MSTPARPASGIIPTGPDSTSTNSSSTTACTIDASLVRPPDRTFTAVRAMAPVAGIPPNRPEPMDAMPCPTNSRSGSYGPVSARDEATRAESSDSMAANAAIVRAGPSRDAVPPSVSVGKAGIGSPSGSAPMTARGLSMTRHRIVTTAIPTREPGMPGCRRGARSMHPMTMRAAPTAQGTYVQSALPIAWTAATRALELWLAASACPPIVSDGTCCRKMIAAIPSVNPSITGHGMMLTARPRRRAPAASTMMPAMMLTRATVPTP